MTAKMQILKKSSLPTNFVENGCVATVGVFDGVHLGHQHVLKKVTEIANAQNCMSTMVTFAQHPKSLLLGQSPLTITNLEHRLQLFEKCGIQSTLVLNFDKELRSMTATDFVKELLIAGLGLKELVFGFDSKFGRNREGNPESLLPLSKKLGFGISEIAPLKIEGRAVSSTAIREAVQLGDLLKAKCLLGREYSILGNVIAGDKRGRELGFPTANLKLLHELSPPNGVYAAMAKIAGLPDLYSCAVNIGIRPSFNDAEPSIEVHLLDFNKDIYGYDLEISFVEKIRDEIAFSDMNMLKKQIKMDLELVKDKTKEYICS